VFFFFCQYMFVAEMIHTKKKQTTTIKKMINKHYTQIIENNKLHQCC